MTKKQFDEFFRQRLHPLESQVPDRLFESIMQRRKKRRMLVWWTYGTAAIVLGLCLIMAGSYWSLVRPTTTDRIAQTQTTVITPTVVTDGVVSDKSIDVVKIKKNEEKINKAFNDSKIEQNAKNTKNKNNSNLATTEVAPLNGLELKKLTTIHTKNITDELKNTLKSISKPTTTVTTSQKSVSPKEELAELENLNIRTPEKTTKSPVVEKTAPETTIKSIEKPSRETPNAPLADVEKTDANNTNVLYQLQGPECFVFGKHTQARDFYIEAYGELNGNQRILKNKKNDFGTKYLDKRNETEQAMYGLGAGLRAVILVNQQLSVKAGVSYAEILERFEYIDKEYEIIERDPLTGLVTTIQKGTSKQKSYNRYHSVDIPFTIGYELHNNKIGFGLDLGAAFNIGAWQKGDMFNAEDKIVSFGKNASDTKYPIVTPFQTIIGASVLADLSFYYRLDAKAQLFFQPHIRYYLNSFTKTNDPLDQRYLTGGLQVGVRKKF